MEAARSELAKRWLGWRARTPPFTPERGTPLGEYVEEGRWETCRELLELVQGSRKCEV